MLILAKVSLIAALVGSAYSETGKLRLAGGISSVESVGGGGTTPWAVIGSQATDGENGVFTHASPLKTDHYGLTTLRVSRNAGLYNALGVR